MGDFARRQKAQIQHGKNGQSHPYKCQFHGLSVGPTFPAHAEPPKSQRSNYADERHEGKNKSVPGGAWYIGSVVIAAQAGGPDQQAQVENHNRGDGEYYGRERQRRNYVSEALESVNARRYVRQNHEPEGN